MSNDWSERTMYSPLFCFGWTREDYWKHKEYNEWVWYKTHAMSSLYLHQCEWDAECWDW